MKNKLDYYYSRHGMSIDTCNKITEFCNKMGCHVSVMFNPTVAEHYRRAYWRNKRRETHVQRLQVMGKKFILNTYSHKFPDSFELPEERRERFKASH